MLRVSIRVFAISIILISFYSCKSKMTKSDDPFDQEMERRMLLETKAKSTNKSVTVEEKDPIVPVTIAVNSFIRNAEVKIESNSKLIIDLKKKVNPSSKLTRKITNLQERNLLLIEKIRIYKNQLISNQQVFEADVIDHLTEMDKDFTSIYENRTR